MLIAVVVCPEQIVWLLIVFKVGFDLSVIVKVWGVPEQPFKVGVTETVAVISVPELLSGAIQLEIFSFPFAVRPIFVLLLVHINDAPKGVLEKLPIAIVFPGHTLILFIVLIIGLG